MYLRLGQLVYTSFAGIGFNTLASVKVPQSVRQAFTQRIVSQYWDAYAPPVPEYRAVYLQQLASDQTIFGWLYNDGVDDLGRSNVPYFICYYMTAPLLNFQLENIFTCLRQGPIVLVDRHSLTPEVETNVLPDLWSYQPVRPGVVVPQSVRQSSYSTLRRRELLDVFVPCDAPGVVDDLKWQTKEQQTISLSIYTHCVIEGIGNRAAIILEHPAIRAIPPYQAAEQKLPQQQTAQPNLPSGYLTKMISRRRSRLLQPSLSYSDQPLEPVKAWLSRHRKTFPAAAIATLFPQQYSQRPISTGMAKHFERLAAIAYNNAQSLLKIGIAAVVIALATATYGIFHPSSPRASNSEVNQPTTKSVFAKTLAEVADVPSGVFNYGGSTSFAPLRSQTIVAAINQAHPQYQLNYAPPAGKQPGSSTGIQMLLAGELSFAQSSRPLNASELLQAKQRGFNLEQVPIAIDAIALYINPQLPISGLSLSQIRDIFTGKVTNWQALGGPNLPITPFSRSSKVSGTVDFFRTQALAGAEFGVTTKMVSNVTESIRQVAATPGGISYATGSEVVGQKTIKVLPLSLVDQPKSGNDIDRGRLVFPWASADSTTIDETAIAQGSYPLARPLFIIINRDGGIDAQAGDAYVKLLHSDQGQKLLKQAGFVPIRQ